MRPKKKKSQKPQDLLTNISLHLPKSLNNLISFVFINDQ